MALIADARVTGQGGVAIVIGNGRYDDASGKLSFPFKQGVLAGYDYSMRGQMEAGGSDAVAVVRAKLNSGTLAVACTGNLSGSGLGLTFLTTVGKKG